MRTLVDIFYVITQAPMMPLFFVLQSFDGKGDRKFPTRCNLAISAYGIFIWLALLFLIIL